MVVAFWEAYFVHMYFQLDFNVRQFLGENVCVCGSSWFKECLAMHGIVT